MSRNKNRQPLGLFDLFLVLFVGLKLAGEIDWPWVYVLSPLWIVIAIMALKYILND